MNADPNTAYVALCAAVKDSPTNVREWIDYHAALGIGKFYLMDTDDPNAMSMETTLQDHISSGLVEFYSLPRVNPTTINLLQVRLYEICLDSVRDRHQFIGFWDVDEFLIPVDQTISSSFFFPDFLRAFEGYGGVGVGWRVVGPSHHVTKPQTGGVLTNYVKCTAWDYVDNEEIKSIVNTKYALHPTSDPHTFVYADGKYLVDAEGARIDSSRNVKIGVEWRERQRPPRLALYHYVTKSEEEYREKMRRGSAMGNRKDMKYFQRVADAATVVCEEALRKCREMNLMHCV